MDSHQRELTMSETDHVHMRPNTATANAVPAEVARYLDGTNLLAKTQAMRLSTVDTAGWPHAALLSAGDMVVQSSERIRFALFPQSTTVANLVRDGRITITLALDGGMYEMRLRARPLTHSSPDVPLAFFEATVETTRIHVAPYAAVVSGITFELHDPQAVLPRWQRQIAALRATA
jgi:Pyridoxamine 5'-phosphate oxidase